MPKLSDVCSYVRSKNAGPFWITLDLTFLDRESYDRYSTSSALQPAAIGARFDVDPEQIKCFFIPTLNVVKVSYPRRKPQGGILERDMHGGQQYLRILDVELCSAV